MSRFTQLKDSFSVSGKPKTFPDGDLVAYFQPIVKIADSTIEGFEALARLRKTSGGLALPSQFIEGHESYCDPLILEQACQFVQTLKDNPEVHWDGAPLPDDFFVSVNLHPKTLIRHKAQKLTQIVADYGVPPGNIQFEILEHDFPAGTEGLIVERLSALKEAGHLIAMDDYDGSAMHQNRLTTLLYEKNILSSLKLDGPFARAAGQGTVNVEPVKNASPSLLKIVAEAISKAGEPLIKLGATHIQSNATGKPASARMALDAMSRHSLRHNSRIKSAPVPY